MSLYADYLTERTSDLILETDEGFATYRFLNGYQVYIVDIYVKPGIRNKGIASSLADDIAVIAKERGCTEMIGTVVPSTKSSSASLRTLLAYGMDLLNASNDLIILVKGI